MVPYEKLFERLEIQNSVLFWRNGPKSGKEAGHKMKDGYILVRVKLGDKKYPILAHRILFYFYNGYLPELVDHKDRNTENNTKENLRDATKSLNAFNSKTRSTNVSGKTGVRQVKLTGRWEAYMGVGLKKIHLGSFKTFEEAVEARIKAEEKYFVSTL